MAILWPAVNDRVVAILRSLWGARADVFDGPPVTGDAPTAYVTVGYVLGEVSGGDFTFTNHSEGWGTTETGSVRCELVASDGATDLPAVRATAFGLLEEFRAALDADETLGGVLPRPATARLVVDVFSQQTQAGAVQRLPFTVEYSGVSD